jgi:hypothetical protein
VPCDLSKNRRKLHWQRLQDENAPCEAQTGFLLDGAMAREYWVEFQYEQTHPEWTWLNGGFILSNGPVVPPFFGTGRFSYVLPSELAGADLYLTGGNYLFGPPEAPITVGMQLYLYNLNVVSGPIISAVASFNQLLAPSNLAELVFAGFVNVIPGPGGEPMVIGGATVTPLIACHDCTSGS